MEVNEKQEMKHEFSKGGSFQANLILFFAKIGGFTHKINYNSFDFSGLQQNI